jgi:glyceraldehyde 3-phosphate dehydrogenase
MVKVGINGFGRIGRLVYRAGLNHKDIQFVAVNDLPVGTQTLAHLLKYDSTFGILKEEVKAAEAALIVNGKELKVTSHKLPSEIPWKALGADIVVESTGIFTEKEKAGGHISAGAKKVIISAPANDADVTIVIGVNDNMYEPKKHHLISNASCTTNCLAPMAKVLWDNFGIKRGLMTTIHSYTNDQKILDLPHKDLRRARAACLSMIPTSTGAAKAIGAVLPQLKGKMDGYAMRVPTPDVSVTDLTCELEKATNVHEINAAFKKASQEAMSNILEYSEAPLVSRDFIGNPKSCIFDPELTKVIDGNFVKIVGWYDNEWGYSCRIVDLIDFIAKKGI